MVRRAFVAVWLAAFFTFGLPLLPAQEKTRQKADAAETKKPDGGDRPAPAKPKPLADYTTKGLAYIVSQQQPNGGFGQGGGWHRARKAAALRN